MKNSDIKLSLKGFNYYCRFIENPDSKYDPMLLLSGAFQNMDSWKNFTKVLSENFSVVLIDLPGSGKADFLPYRFGADFLVEAISHMFDHLKIKKANIIAASYGTPTAFNFAAKYPEKVAHLIMGGVMKEMPEERKNDVVRIYQHANQGDRKAFARETTKLLLNCEESKNVNKSSLVKRVMECSLARISKAEIKKMVENTRRILHHGTLDLSKAASVPTLVYTGEYDHFTKPEYCREVAGYFNRAIFTTIKKADHLFHIEQTKTVIEMGIRFVKGESIESLIQLNKIEYLTKNAASVRPLYQQRGIAI